MILGCEVPRIFTPEARDLSPATSDGWAAIAFAEEMLGITLFPWQRWLLIHALELNEDFTYRFRTVIVCQARQNGKTLIMILLALWHIYAKGSRTVIATAQDLAKAEDAWAAAVEWAQEDEELSELINKISLAHPKIFKVMNPIIGKLCEYRVASASRRGGRGFTGDLVLLDELREHQSWDSWAAVTKTIMARPRAQVWAFSNAGDAMSIVWRYQRALAHRELGWPDGDADAAILEQIDEDVDELLAELSTEFGADMASGWFEWSAPPGAKRTDRHAWGQSNGSMNHVSVVENCITERAIAHALRTDPASVFDQEVLCRYVPFGDGGPFPEGSWAATCDPEARPASGAPASVCVEVSTTRSQTTIASAAAGEVEGSVVVGVAESKPGTDWVVGWLVAHRTQYAGVVIRSGAGSPVLSLLQEIVDTLSEDVVIEWKAGDVGAAHGQLFDHCVHRTIKHLPHNALDAAATSAAIKMQPSGGWIVDPLKSVGDVAPLYAAIGACWGVACLPDRRPSIYAGPHGRDVLVV